MKACQTILSRFSDDFNFENIQSGLHLIFVGNGAISGGWEVVRKALEEAPIASDNEWHFHGDPEVELGYAAMLGRMHRNLKNNSLREKYKDIKESYDGIKASLAKNYSEAKLQLNATSYLDVENIDWRKTVFLTTNWDKTLFDDVRIKNLVHIHGLCSHPESLILPTEMALEYGESHPHKETLSTVHGIVTGLLDYTTQFTFWGIEFHTYDIELISLIAIKTRANEKLEKITLINLNNKMNVVEKRIRAIMQPRKSTIVECKGAN